MNQKDKDQGNNEEQKGHGPEGRVQFPAIHGAAHIRSNGCGEAVCRGKEAGGERFHLADDHGYCQCFTKGSGKTQDNGSEDSGQSCRNQDFVNHLPPGGTKTISTFDEFPVDRAERIGRDGGDGRVNHDGKDNGRCQHALPMRKVERFLQERHEDHQAYPAINDGWNAYEDFYCRADDLFTGLRGNLGHEYGGADGKRNGDNQCQEAGEDGAPDENGRTDFSAAYVRIGRFPGGGEKEFTDAVVEIRKCEHAFCQKEAPDGNGEDDEEQPAYGGNALPQYFSSEHMLLPHIAFHNFLIQPLC